MIFAECKYILNISDIFELNIKLVIIILNLSSFACVYVHMMSNFKTVNYNKLIRRFLSYSDHPQPLRAASFQPFSNRGRKAVRVKATIIILFARLFL